MNADAARIQIEPYLKEISRASRRRDGEKNSQLSPTSVPYRQLAAIQTTANNVLTTIRFGCCGSGSLLAFFAASCPASRPAFGFASFVPLRACCRHCQSPSAATSLQRSRTDRSFPPFRSIQRSLTRVYRYAVTTTQRLPRPDELVAPFQHSWL